MPPSNRLRTYLCYCSFTMAKHPDPLPPPWLPHQLFHPETLRTYLASCSADDADRIIQTLRHAANMKADIASRAAKHVSKQRNKKLKNRKSSASAAPSVSRPKRPRTAGWLSGKATECAAQDENEAGATDYTKASPSCVCGMSHQTLLTSALP